MSKQAEQREYNNVNEYIIQHRVEKGCEFTHTSLCMPACSFYVPADDIEMFYQLYAKAIEANKPMHVTEKTRHIGPIVIDLDFRWLYEEGSVVERKYNNQHIRDIVEAYCKVFKSFFELEQEGEYRLYVLEKKNPIVSNGFLKDGIHIIIPDLVTRASVKLAIRNEMLSILEPIIQSLGAINPIKDIVDEAIIEKNNWLMFKSRKPNGEPYHVSSEWVFGPMIETSQASVSHYSTLETVKLHSIRNKYIETPLCNLKKDDVLKIEEDQKKQLLKKDISGFILSNEVNNHVFHCGDIEKIEKLVDILDSSRSDDYNDWIRLGWCLRNIDNNLLNKWIEFSQKSKKFKPGECERMWKYMKNGGLGSGTLHMWAKMDNLDKYKAIMKSSLKNLLYQSFTGTHYDVAQVVYFLYQHEFVCSSIKSKQWYEFRNHRWITSDSGYGLRCKISDEVWKEYHQANIDYTQAAIAVSDKEVQDRYLNLAKKMNEIAIKLRTTSFKDNLMKECAELFYVEKFEEKLDSNPALIGFNNGVYDMNTFEFREGRPEDFISYTTRNDYIEFNEEHKFVKDIYVYMSQVLTKQHVRDYVLKLFASFLNGAIKEQKFYIWTGSGSNSKSKLVELFEKSFGDYCCKLPISLLTQKRVASNAATSELARAKGKRFASLQEPGDDEKLNIGLMKELSGGDVILARSLFKEPIEFKPMFKMLLLCNQLPAVPSDDGGTWRRIRVVEFTSKFTEDPKGENEFPVDYELSDKIDVWAPYFMSILLHYYKLYLKEGASEPEEVIKCTLDYKNQNDYYSLFLETHIEKKDSGFLSLDDVYVEFKNWIKDDGVPIKIPSKPDLERYLTKNLTKSVTYNSIKGFKGYRLVTNIFIDDDDDKIR